MKARYIVFEGIQGTGKTTQLARVADWLRDKGQAVSLTREPGGADAVARSIRRITQDPTLNINTKTEVLLYNAARAQSLENIRDLLSRGVWVLADRSYLTTLAIQYYARGDIKEYDDIAKICEFAVGDMMPDMTFVFDIEPAIAKERIASRYQGERFDNLPLDFLVRMREGYIAEAKKRDLVMIDASKDVDAVNADVIKYIQQLAGKGDSSSWRAVNLYA